MSSYAYHMTDHVRSCLVLVHVSNYKRLLGHKLQVQKSGFQFLLSTSVWHATQERGLSPLCHFRCLLWAKLNIRIRFETCWQLLVTMLYADCSNCNAAASSVPAQVKTTSFNTNHVLIITSQHRGQHELVQTTSECRRHSTEETLTSWLFYDVASTHLAIRSALNLL